MSCPAAAALEAPLTIAVHAIASGMREALAADVREGLGGRPKRLSSTWFYDERGSELFDAITRLPEYYQTRTESALIDGHAGDVLGAVRPASLVEIGAGSCAKSRTLIAAGRTAGTLRRYVPFDVSDTTLQAAARALITDFPGLRVHAVVGEFERHLPLIPRFDRQLVVFLGSTIGNLADEQRAAFLRAVRDLLAQDDAFLLGVDLVKDTAELEAAYNDGAGLTADFNRNILRVLNRELGSDFDPQAFDHVAFFDEGRSRIEMHLRARSAMTVEVPGAGTTVRFEAGETVRTELSAKFTRDAVEGELRGAGMGLRSWYPDAAGRFALALAVPGGTAPPGQPLPAGRSR